ncbi:MAG: Gfo/Idh/MocA family oxidoreductase, partial [Abditibacteriales bacterium]|nr:Gfo/Idh/MocA family oxidoreductase [Abditibacteriales bacterium]MDW8368264.1 Gfo/Idh/MocA family oxidoreductase [Abditibacteriales bacterium]
MKVAVIGASGIGKQHAKWFHLEGCEVVAYVGRTPDSVRATEGVLKGLFDFRGRGYTDVEEMLKRETPDIVAVCTPPDKHAEHAILALRHGAHVFCEKPMVWDKTKNIATVLADGRAILDAAQAARRFVGVNTQYVAVLPDFEKFKQEITGTPTSGTPRSFYFEMESKGAGGQREYDDIWLDMGPHPLSLLMAWLPGGRLQEDGARCEIARKETRVTFNYLSASGEPCAVRIICRNIAEGTPIRRFGIDGFIVDYSGHNNA